MNKIKLFFKKKSVKVGLLMLLIMALLTIPFARNIAYDLRLSRLDPWESMFEVVHFTRGRRPPFTHWDITAEGWEDRVISIIEHDQLADPVGFVNIRDKDVALEAANEVLIQLQNEGRFINNVPVSVYFNTKTNQWFILYLYQTPKDEPLGTVGGGLTIVIDRKDGSIVKIFYAS